MAISPHSATFKKCDLIGDAPLTCRGTLVYCTVY